MDGVQLVPDPYKIAGRIRSQAQAWEQEGELDEYRRMRNVKLAREISEPSAREIQQQTQELDLYKFTVNKYTEMIQNDKTSPAAREVMKERLRSFAGTIPSQLREALAPALSFSPIDPVSEQLERFERLNPRPQKPVNRTMVNGVPTFNEERTETNEKAWAEYDFAAMEWNLKHNLMKDKLTNTNQDAKEYAPPKFVMGQDNKLWYKDQKTGQVSWIDTKNLPEAEVKTSVDKGWQTFNDILRTGMVITREPKYATYGDVQYELRQVKDVATGKTIVEKVPLGPAEGKGAMSPALDDAFAAFQLGITSGKDYDKLPMRVKGLITMLKEVDDAKDDPKKFAQMTGTLNNVLRQQYGYVLVKNTNEVENSWAQKLIPGVEKYTMAGGLYSAIPVNKEMVSFTGVDDKGQPKAGLFYYNDVLKMALDARGVPIEATKGVEPNSGQVVPGLAVKDPGEAPKAPVTKQTLGDVIMEDWKSFTPKIKDIVTKAGPVQSVKNTIENFNLAMVQKSRAITASLDKINTDTDLIVEAFFNWIKGRGWQNGDKTLHQIITSASDRAGEDEKPHLVQLKKLVAELEKDYGQFKDDEKGGK